MGTSSNPNTHNQSVEIKKGKTRIFDLRGAVSGGMGVQERENPEGTPYPSGCPSALALAVATDSQRYLNRGAVESGGVIFSRISGSRPQIRTQSQCRWDLRVHGQFRKLGLRAARFRIGDFAGVIGLFKELSKNENFTSCECMPCRIPQQYSDCKNLCANCWCSTDLSSESSCIADSRQAPCATGDICYFP